PPWKKTIAGERTPADWRAGRKSWPWMARPSPAGKTTCCGVTSVVGKSDGIAEGSRSRTAAPTRMAACKGRCAPDFRKVMTLGSVVGAGWHSIPCPGVSAVGVPLDGDLPEMAPVDIV